MIQDKFNYGLLMRLDIWRKQNGDRRAFEQEVASIRALTDRILNGVQFGKKGTFGGDIPPFVRLDATTLS